MWRDNTFNVGYLLLGVVAVQSLPALGVEVDLGMGVGLEHTDNSTRVATGVRSDVERKANVALGLRQQGASLDADLAYTAEYIDFHHDTQDDSTEVVGDLDVEYRQIENRLRWLLHSSTRNIKRDAELVDTTSNRENRTITSLSPELTLRPSNSDLVTLGASYTDIAYEDSDVDSDRVGATAGYSRLLSPVDSMGVNISYQDVSFDIDNADYDYQRAVVFYEARLSRLTYNVSVGYNETDRDSDSDTSAGGYYALTADYSQGYSSLELAFLQELTDTSRGDNNDSITDFNPGQNLDTVAVYERQNLQLTYATTALCDTCDFSLNLAVEKSDYEGVQSNTTESIAGVRFGYALTRNSRLGADLSYSEMTFDDVGGPEDYEEQRYRLSWSNRITRDLSFDIYTRFEKRSADTRAREYDEWSGGLSLQYTFL